VSSCAPAPAAQLDTAWLAVAERLSHEWFHELPLVFGGRSSGARVACRTAEEGLAVAVLCLAFPVHPPGKPEKSRMPELDGVTVPTLVIQGESDPFGMPGPGHHREIVVWPGDHSLKRDATGISRTVEEWLGRILRPLD
jgi:predicted alpha/beta-hydrolase family hydrolase